MQTHPRSACYWASHNNLKHFAPLSFPVRIDIEHASGRWTFHILLETQLPNLKSFLVHWRGCDTFHSVHGMTSFAFLRLIKVPYFTASNVDRLTHFLSVTLLG